MWHCKIVLHPYVLWGGLNALKGKCVTIGKRIQKRDFVSTVGSNSKGSTLGDSNLKETQDLFEEHSTNFGFEKVAADQKENRVKQVFQSVAANYDLMNDITSLGIHRCWKDHMIDKIRPVPGLRLLDVAGGTGDIAIRFVKQAKINGLRLGIQSQDQPTQAVVYDINPAMLAAGQARPGVPGNVSWIEGNAEKLPFDDGAFDVVTIGFGIRNVTHIDRVLQESHRVLKSGGRFLCLEFSRVESPVFSM